MEPKPAFVPIPRGLLEMDLSHKEKLVLIALESHAWEGQVEVFPSMARLSDLASLPIRKRGTSHEDCAALRSVLRGLVKKGLLRITKEVHFDGTSRPRERSIYNISGYRKACDRLREKQQAERALVSERELSFQEERTKKAETKKRAQRAADVLGVLLTGKTPDQVEIVRGYVMSSDEELLAFAGTDNIEANLSRAIEEALGRTKNV